MIHAVRFAPGTSVTRLVLVALCVAGCTGSPSAPVAPTPGTPPATGDWFCQMSPSGAGWECVQDDERAADPRPDRLPPAARRESEPSSPPPPDATDAGVEPPEPSVDPDEPLHVRLAYRPREPVPLTELPDSFYAVQVLTMTSKDELETFVAREGLSNMTAAQVERDGRLYYVLLLGIYETRERAERAAADLPPPFHDSTPWIRRLGALQDDMRRAEAGQPRSSING